MVDIKRYERNHRCISQADQQKLSEAKVCVLGCGGLGGYIIEMLARIGVESLTVVDGDVFDETNLNRQLLSDHTTIGQSKVQVAKQRLAKINDRVWCQEVNCMINRNNAVGLLSDHDLIMDALDCIDTRKMVAEVCSELEIPYVYGAIAGWYGQVATIYPGDRTLDILYRNKAQHGKEKELGNPSFTPGLIASIQVAEAVKVISGKGEQLRNGFIHIDTLNNDYEYISLE